MNVKHIILFMKQLDLPFYENDKNGVQCLQVTLKTILKYFLDREYSLNELDKLTFREGNKWTWTHQIIPVLYDMNLDVIFYSIDRVENYMRGEEYIRELCSNDEDFNIVMKHTDIEVVVNTAQQILNYGIFENKKISLDEIEKEIENESLVVVLVNANILYEREKTNYQGHFITLTGFDEEYIYYHESGPNKPTPNSKVKKEIFQNAFDAQGTGNDCIIVRGVKK